jgi:kynurenine formamidase
VTITMLEISHAHRHALDCPLHFIWGGSTVTDMALDATVGPARVIDRPPGDHHARGTGEAQHEDPGRLPP